MNVGSVGTEPELARNGKPKVDFTGAEWLCSSQGVGDVQIAFVDGYIGMRDGRQEDGPVLVFTPAEWRAFVLGARDGEFDLT
ncbi:DUF397 domain-containing protein [Streptomyces sp. CBMA123]|uniref:DUF397 domain-containing protein n=1 Tax=Streptomyces sp. CBMA123 TaxID=1896313 RepID=UPI001661CDD8|nr:DUF397 domain-containing protein [Streptomyces sp. CBMA123]MBD0690125.1 DUF397 domain-containing protein [Streptomyces sp. CBMA123]